jgi:hypothetical protein
MSSVDSYVGATPVPYPVGDEGSAISDHAVDVLLSYLGHWIAESLDDKLLDLGGQKLANETPTSACPVANRFAYSHETIWPNNPRPSLYLWWDGNAQTIPKTLVYELRQRVLNFTWIYTQIRTPKSAARNGLLAAVDATIRRAFFRGSHPTWSYSDGTTTYPAGMNAGRVAGLYEWQMGQTKTGMFAPVPEVPGGREGPEQNFYPALMGTITIWERIGADSFDRQTDANVESTIEVNASENGGFVEEPIAIGTAIVSHP